MTALDSKEKSRTVVSNGAFSCSERTFVYEASRAIWRPISLGPIQRRLVDHLDRLEAGQSMLSHRRNSQLRNTSQVG